MPVHSIILVNRAGKTLFKKYWDEAATEEDILLFEQALQQVDATVAIPYWEYTIDDYKYCSDESPGTSKNTCWRTDYTNGAHQPQGINPLS